MWCSDAVAPGPSESGWLARKMRDDVVLVRAHPRGLGKREPRLLRRGRIDGVLVVVDAAVGIAPDPTDVHEPRPRRGRGVDGAARERDRGRLVGHQVARDVAGRERQREHAERAQRERRSGMARAWRIVHLASRPVSSEPTHSTLASGREGKREVGRVRRPSQSGAGNGAVIPMRYCTYDGWITTELLPSCFTAPNCRR